MTEMHPPTAGALTADEPYVVNAHVEHQSRYSRLLPFVKWLLLLPHYVAIIVLYVPALLAMFVAFFAVLITGRYPRRLWDFAVGVLFRWPWRVWAYLLLMTDRYPPFTLGDAPDYPARLDMEYPERTARWRPLVQWFLIFPYAVVGGFLGYIAFFLVFCAFWVILFTGRFPRDMLNLVRGSMLWQLRVNAYFYWFVTRYPRFTLD